MSKQPALLLLALTAVPASAGVDAEKLCAEPVVTLRLAPDTSEGAAERMAERKRKGESTDPQRADAVLAGRAEVKTEDDGGANITWKRKPGARGEADCRRRVGELTRRFGDRVSFLNPDGGGMAAASKRALAPVPKPLQQSPSDAGLQSRFFDAGRERGALADGTAVALPPSRPSAAPGAASVPRASMPSSYNRPYSAPPAPGAALVNTGIGAYNGSGTHSRVAGMTIDTDGQLSDSSDPRLAALARRDPHRQRETSFRYANGRSLDPTRVPYVVVPIGYGGARNGELVMVEYNGRSALAIVGDRGPRNRFGEGSMALAVSLGINPSGTSGGVGSGVRYTFLGTTVRASSEADVVAAMEHKAVAMRAAGLLASR